MRIKRGRFGRPEPRSSVTAGHDVRKDSPDGVQPRDKRSLQSLPIRQQKKASDKGAFFKKI